MVHVVYFYFFCGLDAHVRLIAFPKVWDSSRKQSTLRFETKIQRSKTGRYEVQPLGFFIVLGRVVSLGEMI